jgi:nitrate/nitrite transport system permease protein
VLPLFPNILPHTAAAVKLSKDLLTTYVLPLLGIFAVLLIWAAVSGGIREEKTASGFTKKIKTGLIQDLPGPYVTWVNTKKYIVEPFAKREELDQGILRFTWYSLLVVAKGYSIALLVGTPIGFMLGLSKIFTRMFDPIIQILRPVSPLAWMPLGVVLFMGAGKHANDLGALFTIAVCSMWPTVLNTAVGVRAVPQDYLNVAKVLKLSKWKTLWKVLVPATLPYMFTGYRLSLGIAWLVIVAVEMLTGRIGIGNFLWNEYNNGLYTSIILSILTIGFVGWALDRLMSLLESRFKSI